MTEKERLMKDRLVEWYHNSQIQNPYSVTITMKQRLNSFNVDSIRTSTNTKHFLTRLNKKMFGNRTKRFGVKVDSFVVIEGDTNHRLHTHLIVGRPSHITDDHFVSLITQSVERTKWGYNQIDIQKLNTDLDHTKWFFYLLKDRSKTDLQSNIDWLNTHISSMS